MGGTIWYSAEEQTVSKEHTVPLRNSMPRQDAYVGAEVGAVVGAAVGAAVGAVVGAAVGAPVGVFVGDAVGTVGANVGAGVGAMHDVWRTELLVVPEQVTPTSATKTRQEKKSEIGMKRCTLQTSDKKNVPSE
jgi:phage tail tape-measure protein